jgi:hypothetical protein
VSWIIGQAVSITWSTDDWYDREGNALAVKIELSRDNGSSWSTLAASTPNTGIYAYTVTSPAAAQAKVRLSNPSGDPAVVWTSAAFVIQAASMASNQAQKWFKTHQKRR